MRTLTLTTTTTTSISKQKIPSPTLSSSAKRNYRRRDDIDDSVSPEAARLERKLYGRRYKIVSNVYTRLLETL